MKPFLCLAVLVALMGAFMSPATAAAPRKILVVTATQGYRHSAIEVAESVIASLGKSSGLYEVELATATPASDTDPAAYREQVRAMLARQLDAAALKRYDGIVFALTTGELPLPDNEALIRWVKEGGAFVGVHSASDTLHGYRPYIDMLGGEFDHHREQVTIQGINRDASHPANRHLPAAWDLEGQKEEIYLFKNYQREAVHELIVLDRHPNTGEAGHFPISWCRDFGRGRVFYTALGHNEQVWQMPAFRQHLLGGIAWALKLQ
ncbi:MAG TPA: ThuA domain-containing protein [Ideonella sp.]|nr:ThuA domain-containing protein [Ideonella sp.]